jgi:glycosyltransferase involved in cell wall biosynthesis
MKILHLIHAYYPAIGGSEYLMQQVSEYLAGQAGDDVTVFTTFAYNSGIFTNPKLQPMPASKSEEVINHVKIRRFPVSNRWAKLLYVIQYILYRVRFPGNGFWRMLYYGPVSPGMKKAVKEFAADIIVSAPFPLNHMSYGFKNRGKAPLILVGCLHTADRHGFHNPRIRAMIRKAQGYIALTPHEKEFLVEHWGIDAEKIKVLGIGIDIRGPAGNTGANPVREELGCGLQDPLLAFVGQHGLHKGIKTLIRAMPLVWDKHPKAHLIIAGGTTPFTGSFKFEAYMTEMAVHMQQCKDEAQRFSFPDNPRIRFMDNIDESRKYEILDACDIFATPSGFESFGITILEAWLKKKPVVACDIEVTRNLVEDGETGLLVEYEDKQELANTLIRLIENPRLRQELGEKGRQKLEKNYTREIVGKKYREFYKKCCQGAHGMRNL